MRASLSIGFLPWACLSTFLHYQLMIMSYRLMSAFKLNDFPCMCFHPAQRPIHNYPRAIHVSQHLQDPEMQPSNFSAHSQDAWWAPSNRWGTGRKHVQQTCPAARCSLGDLGGWFVSDCMFLIVLQISSVCVCVRMFLWCLKQASAFPLEEK